MLSTITLLILFGLLGILIFGVVYQNFKLKQEIKLERMLTLENIARTLNSVRTLEHNLKCLEERTAIREKQLIHERDYYRNLYDTLKKKKRAKKK